MVLSLGLKSCRAGRLNLALQGMVGHNHPRERELGRPRLQSESKVYLGETIIKKLYNLNLQLKLIPVLNQALEASSPVSRAAPIVTRVRQCHTGVHIPLGTLPVIGE